MTASLTAGQCVEHIFERNGTVRKDIVHSTLSTRLDHARSSQTRRRGRDVAMGSNGGDQNGRSGKRSPHRPEEEKEDNKRVTGTEKRITTST